MQKIDASLEWGEYLANIRGDNHDQQTLVKTEKHMTSHRYAHTKRHYTANDVSALKSSIDLVTPAHYMSQKLYKQLRTTFEKREAMSCYGALDNVQMINATKYQPCIYVSGW